MLFGLVRVSHKSQCDETQMKQLLEYGVPKENIFIEHGVSGVIELKDRPILQDLLTRLRAGDCLIVCRLDRLARSMRSLLDLVEMLNEREINFVSLHEDIRTDTPQGKLVFHVFAAVAEFQRSLIKQSQRDGIDNCLENGKPYGRPSTAEKNPESLEAAINLYVHSNQSTREIAKATGISRNTLYRELEKQGIPKRSEQ